MLPSHQPGSRSLTAAILALGASGIVAQTVLLREMLTLFGGNEFALGIIIGSWVVCEALGALAGGRWEPRFGAKVRLFVALTILFSVIFPAALYLTRIFKTVAGIPPEIAVGYGTILYASFLLMLPVGIVHGFLFIVSCSLLRPASGSGPTAVGRAYFLDTVGIIGGGIIVTYLLIPFLDSFQISCWLAAVNATACTALTAGTGGRRMAALFLAGTLLVLAAGIPQSLHDLSIRKQWKGRGVVASRNSFYQNITVVKNENQYTFFTDGLPLITTPVPDIAFMEEFVHLPMLTHPSPQNVLVLSGGAGGVLNEILKYATVTRVDYVETDPMLLKSVEEFPTTLTTRELHDPRVHLHPVDGRVFIRQAPTRYDVVFVGLPLPHTLQENRYFTAEFYAAARGLLKENGILALAATGSLTYYSDELKSVNASVLRTLAPLFPKLRVVPGDTNILMASVSGEVAAPTAEQLGQRLQERDIATLLVSRPHLEYRLDEEKRQWFDATVRPAAAEPNQDFSPSGLFYNLAFRNLLFFPWMRGLFLPVKKYGLAGALVLVAAVSAAVILAGRKRPRLVIPYAIATTGLSAMLLELILFAGFQAVYGHVFHAVGLLITSFMGGMAVGSRAMTGRLDRLRRPITSLAATEGAIIGFSLLLCGAYRVMAAGGLSSPLAVHAAFLPLLFLAGLLTGLEFPLANSLYTPAGGGATEGAGVIYGADLIGGWLGGLLGGLFLLPVLGFYQSLLLIALLKTGSLVALLGYSRSAFDFGR